MNSVPRVREILSADDPAVAELSTLMDVVFADPNTVLGVERMREFLAANRPGAARRFCILVATDGRRADVVIGGTVFSYVVRSNCGFSEYLVAAQAVRGRGIGRLLVDARKDVLDREARLRGHEGCRGVFIEVDNPDRTPPDLVAAERETALDAVARLRLFDHLGFRRVGMPYVQPPLGSGKSAVDYLDLLFASWQAAGQTDARIPCDWVLETVEAIWSAWTPDFATYLLGLEQHTASEWVSLEPVVLER